MPRCIMGILGMFPERCQTPMNPEVVAAAAAAATVAAVALRVVSLALRRDERRVQRVLAAGRQTDVKLVQFLLLCSVKLGHVFCQGTEETEFYTTPSRFWKLQVQDSPGLINLDSISCCSLSDLGPPGAEALLGGPERAAGTRLAVVKPDVSSRRGNPSVDIN
ncbi:uncharacterized protein V6R79_003689 [Siganus canaliculatus]